MARDTPEAPAQALSGSRTQTQTQNGTPVQPILHLRAQPKEDEKTKKKKERKPRVQWTEDVIDNENMGKKKLKICCIFHPNREFDDDHNCEEELSLSSDDSENEEAKPNAYERQPKYHNHLQLPKDPA